MIRLSFVNHMLCPVVFKVHYLRFHTFVFIFRVSGELLQNIWPGEVAFIPRGI